MTWRAGLACLVGLAVAVAPAGVAAKPVAAGSATAKASAGNAAKRKRVKHRAARIRWRASASALRVTGPGFLFGGGSFGGGPLVPTPTPGGPPSPGPVTPPAAPTPIHTLSVASREYSLTLSRQVLTPGLETIQLNNRGEDPHDLVISLDDDGVNAPIATYPETPSLESHTEKVELPAGRYKLFCSLPGHEQLGMRATLRVE